MNRTYWRSAWANRATSLVRMPSYGRMIAAISYTPSPVLHDGKLYMLTDNGMLSCFNARTGEAYYRQQSYRSRTTSKRRLWE